MNETVSRYLDTWNATNPARRAELLESHWSPTCIYVDPLAQAEGHVDVGATIDAVHNQFPGFVFTSVGEPDAHHSQVRFRWGLGPADADPVIIGFDVIVLDDGGRIHDVRGFLDQVPA